MKHIIPLIILLFSLNPCKAQTESLTVYIFLSETCPICQNQTLTLKELYKNYKDKGVLFVGIFPNQENSTEETIQKFAKKYKIPFELKKDENQILTKEFAATVTPQVFLVKTNTHKILYSGKVDNSFERIGKRRQVITEFYLKDALENLFNNESIKLPHTQPVGCLINSLN